MPITAQWVLFRTSEAELLRTPLPSATSVAEGWRGVPLQLFMPLDQLDILVSETAAKTEAAIGIAVVASEVGYVVAAGRGGVAFRLVLEAKSAQPGAEVLSRAGIDMQEFDAWASRSADAVASWSELTPRRAEADPVRSILVQDYTADEDAVVALLELLGLALPEGSVPTHADLQSLARDAEPDAPQRRSLFRRKKS